MLAKSIISDQNFLTKRRIELAQNKNVVGRQEWFWRPKGFILQKKKVIAQECLNQNRFNFTLFGFKNPDSPTFELVELIIPWLVQGLI